MSLMAGLFGRCPRCRRGRLFSGYLSVKPVCGHCGLDLSEHDAADAPAVAGIFVVGGIIVALMLHVELTYEPPTWVHLALWLPLGLILVLGILRPLKGLSVALHYRFQGRQ